MRFFLFGLLFAAQAAAAPRVLYHPQPVADLEAPQWSMRVEQGNAGPRLLINGPRGQQSYSLVRTPAAEGDTILTFEKTSDERAVQDLLADVKDTYESIGSSGSTGGSSALVGFINEIHRRDGAEGVIIQQTTEGRRGFPWGWTIGALALGVLSGALGMRGLGKKPEEESVSAVPAGGTGRAGASAKTTPAAAALKKELKAAVAKLDRQEARIKALQGEAAASARAATERDALQAELAETGNRLRETQAGLRRAQAESEKHETAAARYEAYFRAAATQTVQPFSEFIHSARLEGAEGESRLLRDLLRLGWHHYSAVRFFSGTHDADDRYNVSRFAAVGDGTQPTPVSATVKSGELGVVLATASLLRAHDLTDLGDVSIKGRIFSSNA